MHTFLMEAGRWQLKGSWLERHQATISVQGQTLVAWSPDNWFTMVTKLMLARPKLEVPEISKPEEISLIYKGRVNSTEDGYTFVLQHSMLGRLEGEGWVAPESIVQRYWAIETVKNKDKSVGGLNQQCSGFENWYRLNERSYHLSSSIVTGHHLFSTMEVLLEKC